MEQKLKHLGKDFKHNSIAAKHNNSKLKEKIIVSPIAKFDSLGNLSCILCRVQIKSTTIWKAHINSKQHKINLQATKCFKKDYFKKDLNKDKSINVEEVPSNGTDKKVIRSDLVHIAGGELIPEQFFDDPICEVKIRNNDAKNIKDNKNDEWEKFKREITELSSKSENIIMGQQLDSNITRQLEEIDDQIGQWAKVLFLEKKKNVIHTSKVKTTIKTTEMGDSSDEESICFNEFSDWRSKKFH